METSTTAGGRTARLDAPFWAVVLLGAFSLASIGCFAMAAAQASRGPAPGILTTDHCPPPAEL